MNANINAFGSHRSMNILDISVSLQSSSFKFSHLYLAENIFEYQQADHWHNWMQTWERWTIWWQISWNENILQATGAVELWDEYSRSDSS